MTEPDWISWALPPGSNHYAPIPADDVAVRDVRIGPSGFCAEIEMLNVHGVVIRQQHLTPKGIEAMKALVRTDADVARNVVSVAIEYSTAIEVWTWNRETGEYLGHDTFTKTQA